MNKIDESLIENNLKKISDYIKINENNEIIEENEEECIRHNIPKKENINIYKSSIGENYSNNNLKNNKNDKLIFIEKFDNLMKEKIEFYENIMNNLQNEIISIKEENINLKLEKSNKVETIKTTNTENLKLIKDNNIKNKKIQDLNLENKVLLNNKYEKENNENLLKKQLNQIRQELNSKTNLNKENNNEIIKINEMNLNSKSEINTLWKELELNKEENNKKIEIILNEKNILENKLYDSETNFNKILEEKDIEICYLKENMVLFEDNLEKISKLSEENDNLKSENKDLIKLGENLNDKIRELDTDMSGKIENINHLNKENMELNQIIMDSFKKITNLNEINENYYTSIKDLEQNNKINSFKFSNSLEDILRKYEEYIKHYEENKLKIKELEDLNQKWTYQLTELNKETYNLVDLKNNNLEIINKLKEDISHLENIVEQATEENNELSEKCFVWQEENTNFTFCLENCFTKIKMCDAFIETFIEQLAEFKDIIKEEGSIDDIINWVEDSIINIDIVENNEWIDEMEKVFTFIDGVFLRIVEKYKENNNNIYENEKIIHDKEKILFEYRTEINKIKNENNSANWLFKEEKNINYNKDIIINSLTNNDELKHLIKELKLTLEIIDDCFFDKDSNKIHDLINILDKIYNLETEIKYIDEELIEINKKLKQRENHKIYMTRFDSKNKEFKKKNDLLEQLILERNRMKNDLKSYFIVYKQRLDSKNYNLIDKSQSKKIIDSNKEDFLNNESLDIDFENEIQKGDQDVIKKIWNIGFINKLINKK